jgi:hypothetical protein
VVRDDPNERLAFFRPASLPGTELMAVCQSSQPWHMFHARYAFCACRRGVAGVRYRGRDDLVSGGSVLVREPGETHYNTFISEPAEFKTLFIEPPLFLQAARELGNGHGVHFPPEPITQDPYLFRALERLCSSIESADEDLEQQSFFVTALAAVARHAERPIAAAESRSSTLDRAKSHLQGRPGFRPMRIRCIFAWSACARCCKEGCPRRALQRASASPTKAISRAGSSASCA